MLISLENTGVFTGDCMLDQLIGADPEKYEFSVEKIKKIVMLASSVSKM
jgi:hypothetical protein